MSDFGYNCSVCNRKIEMPNLYRVRIQNKKTGYEFKSDVCQQCYNLIIEILKGGLK